jgi:hypothetical protein
VSPNVHVLKAWYQLMVLLGGSRRGGLVRDGSVIGICLSREFGDPLSCFIPCHHEGNRFPLPHSPTTMMFCATTGPKQPSQVTVDWNLWNCEHLLVFAPFKLFISGVLSQQQKADQHSKLWDGKLSRPDGQLSITVTKILKIHNL